MATPRMAVRYTYKCYTDMATLRVAVRYTYMSVPRYSDQIVL